MSAVYAPKHAVPAPPAPAVDITHESCDRCGYSRDGTGTPVALAAVVVANESGHTLAFCAHDYGVLAPGLIAQGFDIVADTRARIS